MKTIQCLFQREVLVVAMAFLACGGGDSGEAVITPFWNRSGLVVADFNGDGRSDLAVAAAYISGLPPHSGYVEIYLHSAAGIFEAPVRCFVAN